MPDAEEEQGGEHAAMMPFGRGVGQGRLAGTGTTPALRVSRDAVAATCPLLDQLDPARYDVRC